MALGYNGPAITGDEDIVWKCEGLTDALAVQSLIESCDPPPNHAAICNSNGAEESPVSAEAVELFRRLSTVGEVFVIHDCDEPGQRGAMWVTSPNTHRKRAGWAIAAAVNCKSVRNVILPYPIEKQHGKDVRDWIEEQSAKGTSDPDIYGQLLELARSMPLIVSGGDGAAAAGEDSQGDEPGRQSIADLRQPGEGTTGESVADENVILEAEDDPDRLARINLSHYETEHGGRLIFYRGEWWKWKAGCWYRLDEDSLRAKVHGTIRREFEARWRENEDRRIEKEAQTGEPETPKPIRKVTTSLLRDVLSSIKSHVAISSQIDLPCWLPTKTHRNYVSMTNGILDFDALFAGKPIEETLISHTPEWFSGVKLPYEFQAEGHCPEWEKWVRQVFNDDQESIEALQMWMGYLLTQANHLHKIMMIIGEKRSGKGTLNKIISDMLGQHAIGYPTMSSLADKFELGSLIGKSLAIMSDMRISDRIDETVVTERLLSISGGDPQDIQRKYLKTLPGVKLNVRFMIFSNQLPHLRDTSGAILSRFIVLLMPNSYYGREDYSVYDRLKKEMPGILVWAIIGRMKLQQAGDRIKQPESALGLIDAFQMAVAPIAKFVELRCGKGGEIETGTLYEAWQEFCVDEGYTDKRLPHVFAQQLRAVLPGVKTKQIRLGGVRQRVYTGVHLLPPLMGG